MLVEIAIYSVQLSIEFSFKQSIYARQRGLIRTKIMLGNGAINFGYRLAPVLRPLRVNLGTEETSVSIHPRQRKGLKVLERCYMQGRYKERQ